MAELSSSRRTQWQVPQEEEGGAFPSAVRGFLLVLLTSAAGRRTVNGSYERGIVFIHSSSKQAALL